MKGALYRLIKKRGSDVNIYNSSGGTGGREISTYPDEPDGTIRVMTQREDVGTVRTDSDGQEVESNIGFRFLPDEDDPDLVTIGSDRPPSIIEHPRGDRFKLVSIMPDDSGTSMMECTIL